jgi:hypothetical protein
MNNYKEYEDFIEILKVLVPIFKKNKKSIHIKKILVKTIRMIEYVSNINVSKAAQDEADRLGLKSLTEYRWEDQTKKSGMNDKKRKIFHWEHYYPVEQIIKDLLSLSDLDKESIYKVIKKTEIVWILKEENKKLDKKYKSFRPDPSKSYKEVGIDLLYKLKNE